MNGINPIWLVAASLGLALVPLLLGAATSYIKVSVILSLLRGGFGAQGVPGALVVASLATVLSLHIMGPVFEESWAAAGRIDFDTLAASGSLHSLQQLEPLLQPWKQFMKSHSGRRELQAVLDLESDRGPTGPQAHADRAPPEPSWRQALLAFILTELRQGFSMGFAMLLPFLVIDIVVANILAGLGMFMLSPTLISLPLKILLFIACDGWLLLSRGLVLSYQ